MRVRAGDRGGKGNNKYLTKVGHHPMQESILKDGRIAILQIQDEP